MKAGLRIFAATAMLVTAAGGLVCAPAGCQMIKPSCGEMAMTDAAVGAAHCTRGVRALELRVADCCAVEAAADRSVITTAPRAVIGAAAALVAVAPVLASLLPVVTDRGSPHPATQPPPLYTLHQALLI